MNKLPVFMENLVNIKNANAKQYQWLYTNYCQHRHKFSTHFNCFIKEYKIEEKIGYLDTEFYVGRNRWGGLAGDWGFILCWVIGDGAGHYTQDAIEPDEVFTTQDKRIVASCIEEIKKYDRIVHHYGKKADIPLLRTRAVINKLPFVERNTVWGTDLWKISKENFCLSSNSQKVISKTFRDKTEKTDVEPKIWMAATRGEQTAINKILAHCKADVKDLERNAKILLPFTKLTRTSI